MRGVPTNSVVLDSGGLSGWLSRDRRTAAKIEVFRREGADPVVCAATIIEVTHAKTDVARLAYLLSLCKVEAVTAESARAASKLLKRTGLHGHKYAIDAVVAEAALRQPGPVAMLTSDTDDVGKLCGPQVRVVAV